MNTSSVFKSNFENSETESNTSYSDESFDANAKNYSLASNARNICFELKNGHCIFFNYAYLISVELNLNETSNCLIVCFSSQTISIKGVNLKELFLQLMQHIPRFVSVVHPRYITNKNESAVWDIEALEK
jgi:hypothetical protein